MLKLALIVTVLVAFVAQARATEEKADWQNRLVAEAPKAWEKYHARAKRLQGTWTESFHSKSSGTRVENYSEIKQRDGCALLVERLGQGSNHVASVANPRYGFMLKRGKSNSGPWTVTGAVKDLWKPNSIDDPAVRADFVSRLPYNFGSVHLYLSMTILDQGFSVKRVTPFLDDGRMLAKVEFSYSPPDAEPRKNLRQGWVLFDPENYWISRKLEVELVWGKEVGFDSVIIEYRAGSDGFPILCRIVNTRKVPSRASEAQTTFAYDLHEADVPESEFTLSGFGFPEPVGMAPPKTARWFLWFALAGVGCLLMGIFLRRRGKQND